jgi:hypothetical protein
VTACLLTRAAPVEAAAVSTTKLNFPPKLAEYFSRCAFRAMFIGLESVSAPAPNYSGPRPVSFSVLSACSASAGFAFAFKGISNSESSFATPRLRVEKLSPEPDDSPQSRFWIARSFSGVPDHGCERPGELHDNLSRVVCGPHHSYTRVNRRMDDDKLHDRALRFVTQIFFEEMGNDIVLAQSRLYHSHVVARYDQRCRWRLRWRAKQDCDAGDAYADERRLRRIDHLTSAS